jgi:leucyl-tRNA synthetase
LENDIFVSDSIFKIWRNAGVYKTSSDKNKKKFFVIFAYPGPSGFIHVGTLRSYTYPDVIAKFKRMTGHNVYFPAGIHASGLPAVQFSEKVRSGKYEDYLKDNNCTPDIIKMFQTPEGVVEFFTKNYAEIWKKMGFFINEETGIPTTIDPGYKKFIQWQFRNLKKNKFLVQKEYISSYCPKDGPVAIDTAETDLSSGGKAIISEYTVIKFPIADINTFKGNYPNISVIVATTRPETIFGVTNIWLALNYIYVVIRIDDEYYIIAQDSLPNLVDPELIESFEASSLEKIFCINPVTNDKIPLIQHKFVKPFFGTGLVMSVPAHSPADFIAYNESIKEGYDIKTPPIVVKSSIIGIPAETSINKFPVRKISNVKNLENATNYINSTEDSEGIIINSLECYNNKPVPIVRKTINKDLIYQNIAFSQPFFSDLVICRCGNRVQLKHIPDQWFIKYSDIEITEKTKDYVKNKLKIYPATLQNQMPDILDWFEDRPCVRTGNWLGTIFSEYKGAQKQKELIIEPIADSTIYPAYYIISKYLQNGLISIESLNDQFFDYVFLGKGNFSRFKDNVDEIRKDFENWYPVDCNFGGKEHNTVHFPVFLKMHTMIFPEKFWPKNIFVNWWVMQNVQENKKIGKSKGGAGSITQILEKYSADILRLYYCHAASPDVDMEWSERKIIQYQSDIEKIKQIIYLIKVKSNANNQNSMVQENDIIEWLRFKMNESFLIMYLNLENYEIRKMAQECYYTIPKIIWRFKHRDGTITSEIINLIYEWIKYLSLITPFLAEELNKEIGFEKSIFSEAIEIQKPNHQIIPSIVEEEEFIDEFVSDLMKLKKAVKKVEIRKIHVFTSNELNFRSKKSEEDLLFSAISYIVMKTGIQPIINPKGINMIKNKININKKPIIQLI